MTNKDKTIIVDVDGTLADGEHRDHFLQPIPGKKRDWNAYVSLMHLDALHEDIIWLVKVLHMAGCRIVIATAREGTEKISAGTKQWLDEVAGLEGVYEKIYFRKPGDHRNDGIVKQELLEEIRADGHNPWMVLDDRDSAVAGWRAAGLRCLQVKEGNF